MLSKLLKGIDQNENPFHGPSCGAFRLESSVSCQLLREHKLEGFQLGRDWYVYTDSLEAFWQAKTQARTKGPRKKSAQTRLMFRRMMFLVHLSSCNSVIA